jgi:hypothetical protein
MYPADAGAGSERPRRITRLPPSKFGHEHVPKSSPMDSSKVIEDLLELDTSKRLEGLQNAMQRHKQQGFNFSKKLFALGLKVGIFPPPEILDEIDNTFKVFYGIHDTLEEKDWDKLPCKYAKFFTESENKHLNDFHGDGPKFAEMIIKYQFHTEQKRTNNVKKFYDDLRYVLNSNVVWLRFLLLTD